MKSVKVSLTEQQAEFIYQILRESVTVTGKEAAEMLMQMIAAFEKVIVNENL